jgi:type II secretory ATPase GspE/PulE/Tfp pilus assembly ATPase PilB-like protein
METISALRSPTDRGGPSAAQYETSAPKLVEELIQHAEKAGASDIHLQMNGKSLKVSFRLDGLLTSGTDLPAEAAGRVFGRIRYLAEMKTYHDLTPQDGRIDHQDIGTQSDVRVSTYPTVNGEKIVLRLFKTETAKTFRELELPEEVCLELERFLRHNSGLLLLTGPAGSGKTSTIYASLRYLVDLGGRHIVTIEDPVEQIVPGVMQTEVSDLRGLTVATAAKHLMRHDPQVVVIGEIRDEETACIAVRAALTGQQVITTLHAGSCAGVYERLMVMCPDHYSVISSVALVLNQRLLRKLCINCNGTGCKGCLHTGYHGRAPVVEWIKPDASLRAKIRADGPAAVQPRRLLQESARELVSRGVTNEAEFHRVFGE